MPSKISKGKASEAVESQFPMPKVFLMKIGCSHTVASGDNEVELEDARKSAAYESVKMHFSYSFMRISRPFL